MSNSARAKERRTKRSKRNKQERKGFKGLGIFKTDPITKTRREVRQLQALIQKFQGPVDVKGEFIKRLGAECEKNTKKGKIEYLKKEYRRYVDCPEFIEFWTRDLGLARATLDNMFPKEARE